MTTKPARAWNPAIDRARIAEIIAESNRGRKRGSGYRVSTAHVITAAHVIDGAASVSARFEPDLQGEWTCDANEWSIVEGSDIAILSLADTGDRKSTTPAKFGRIGRRAALLEAEAVGFPRWKLKNYDGTIPTEGDGRPKFRDAHQAVGFIPVLSNWREGTLEFVVAPSPRGTTVGSPWEGMSGSAVWSGDRIIGVVSKHHPADGLSRLTVARIDLALRNNSALQAFAVRGLLSDSAPESLVDVLPTPPGRRQAEAHRAQVLDIAPDKLWLREQEIDDLVRFCSGEDTYYWLKADPWAGKSALLSWFTTHPPVGIEVVPFFVTRRLVGHSDSEALLAALIEQLSTICGDADVSAPQPTARYGHMLHLLEVASHRCQENGKRLVLIIDGLDEDTGRDGGTIVRPSIASLLPRRPPTAVRIIVASRPHPPLPDDVHDEHPLRKTKTRSLSQSPHAQGIERAAKQELSTLLRGSDLERTVLGLITASGGGLTRADLEELAECPIYELDALLAGVFARTVNSLSNAFNTQTGLVLAHTTLAEISAEKFGRSLTTFRERLHVWAAGYKERGWPANTPDYLIYRYPELLASGADAVRTLAIATDRQRWVTLSVRSGGDDLAYKEVQSARGLLSTGSRPDISGLLILAFAVDLLSTRNIRIPARLPEAWARIDRMDRALALTRGIPDPRARARALEPLTSFIPDGAHRDDQFKKLLSTIESTLGELDPGEGRQEMRAEFAEKLAGVGVHPTIERLVSETRDVGERVHLLRLLVSALLKDNKYVTALATAKDAHEQIIRDPTDPLERAERLCELMIMWSDVGHPSQVEKLAVDAEESARSAATEAWQNRALRKLAHSLVAVGSLEHAVDLIPQLSDGDERAEVWIAVLKRAVSMGRYRIVQSALTLGKIDETLQDSRRPQFAFRKMAEVRMAFARALAPTDGCSRDEFLFVTAEARDLIRRSRAPLLVAVELAALAKLVALSPFSADATEYALEATTSLAAIDDTEKRAIAALDVARVWLELGDLERAHHLAIELEGTLSTPAQPSAVANSLLFRVAELHIAAGNPVRGIELARKVALRPGERGPGLSALTDVAISLTEVGDNDRTIDLLIEIERLARRVDSPLRSHGSVALELANGLAQAGDHSRAISMVSLMGRLRSRGSLGRRSHFIQAAESVMTTLSSAKQYVQSMDMASLIEGSEDFTTADATSRIGMRSSLIVAFTAAGLRERAVEALDAALREANEIPVEDRAWPLARLIESLLTAKFVESAKEAAAVALESVRDTPGRSIRPGRSGKNVLSVSLSQKVDIGGLVVPLAQLSASEGVS